MMKDDDNRDESENEEREKMGCRRMRVKAEKNPRIQTEIMNTTNASIRKIYERRRALPPKRFGRGEDVR